MTPTEPASTPADTSAPLVPVPAPTPAKLTEVSSLTLEGLTPLPHRAAR